jgi:uncharacterized protein YbaP (TraB family)
MRRFLVGLGALALSTLLLAACGPVEEAVPVPAAYTGPPKPALWKIADADTTIYLFGTMHLLPPGLDWETPAVSQAFAEAGTLYLEADTNLPPAEIQAIIKRTGILPPDRNLADLLDPAQQEALRAAGARFGISPVALDRMRPWYASVVISEAAIRGSGFAQDSGVEVLLRPAAIGAGKQMRFLETVDQQLSAFSNLPDAAQVKMLVAGLSDLDSTTEAITQMVTAWRSGDDATLARLVVDEQLATQPEVYETLMVRRNSAWAPQLGALLDNEAGVFMVAVGAGHLQGADSVLALMERLGHTPIRVQ